MIQFDFNRFKTMLRWSLTMDKRWFVKSTLSYLVTLTLLFLFITLVVNYDNEVDGADQYAVCAFVAPFSILFLSVVGPSQMFFSMRGKHDDQVLLMLPASNLEKYVVRYLNWVLLAVFYFAAFLVADVVQYVAHLLVNREGAVLVMRYFVNSDWNLQLGHSQALSIATVYIIVAAVWTHSVYAIGATLFRSHKYNWIYTSIVLIVGGVLLLSAINFTVSYEWGLQLGRSMSLFVAGHLPLVHLLWNGLLLCLAALNFWLSYRLFSRMQVRGRFVNI